ncbi:MAG: hypothetical protein JNJ58_11825 [Chitinophagaceae bacterium]|nr:hypothetical protein [Chitinophagaceae bacterium]
MSNNIWTYISALGSVAFGWLLNELGQWFKTRREDKRIKKKVLFYLLETLYAFRQLDTSEDIEIIAKKVLKRLPKEAQTEEGKKYLESFYKRIIPDLAEDDVADRLEELEDSYKKSIDDLSLVDPISAYRLKGKNRIIETFDQLSNYFDKLKEHFPDESDEIQNQSDTAIEFLKPELLNAAILDLVIEIKNISLSIGLITRYRANAIINISSTRSLNMNKNRMDKIDALLDKLIQIQTNSDSLN